MLSVFGLYIKKNGFAKRTKRRTAILNLILFFALVPPAVIAQAIDSSDAPATPSALTLRGFGTIGVARTTGGDLGYLRDIGQPDGVGSHWSAKRDSVFGLQANYRVAKDWDAALQVASYYRHDETFTPNVTWAYVKYEPTPSLSFRLGRIGTEFLINSDSSKIGYSYLPVRPIPEFYGGLVANYGDGIDMQIRHPVGEGVMRAKAFIGRASEKLPAYSLSGSRLIKGSLGYAVGNWKMDYIHAKARFSNDIPSADALSASLTALGAAQAGDALGLGDTESRYQSIGIAYDNGCWMVQGGINSFKHEYVGFENSRSKYVLIARRFGLLTPYIGYARGKSTPKELETGLPDAFFGAVNDAVSDALATSHGNRHTTTLGVRWDFAKNMDLKLQVDFIRGDEASEVLFDSSSEWSGKGKVFSLSIDFIF